MGSELDLSQCENEPVRFIGSIQNFGALIHLDKNSVITHYSENIQKITGHPGSSLVGVKYSEILFEKSEYSLSEVEGPQGRFIEIEKRIEQKNYNVNPYLAKLQKASDLHSLLQQASDIISEITQLDRVMIYKFHEDNHGEVVAETVKPGVDSFMGLHYPASDIPPQARAIFLENWVRMIPDVGYAPVPMKGNSADGLDLGKTLLRAVSPIHIEYLKNMHVGSSLTISIIVKDKLWGLFACHHNKPHYISKDLRDVCEVIGRMTSSLIREADLKEINHHANELKVIHTKLISRAGKAEDLAQELTLNSPTLIDIVKSDGAAAALYIEGHWVKIGKVPMDEQLDRLAEWLSSQESADIFHTHELSVHFPEAQAYREVASGLLATSIPKTRKNYIFWFRPEIVQTVSWAGNPAKELSMVNGRLHPRASFEEWKESVHGKSLPWQVWEIDAATELRNAIMALDLRRQFEKEQKARGEAERATLAREELMAVVSHDLKNPLSSIQMNAQLIKRLVPLDDDKSKGVADRIHKSAITMNNLIEDILNVTKLEAGHMTLSKEKFPVAKVIDEAIEILNPMAIEKGIKLEKHRDSIECVTEYDYGRMLQVFSNLIGNAIKFTPDYGTITVNVEKCGPEYIQMSVKDTGPGIPKENLLHVFDRFWQANQAKRLGTGLGLSIVKGIIVKHGGEIWAESESGQGTTFVMQLPLI